MRAERLSLKGAQFHLECENAGLKDCLERSAERERILTDDKHRRGGKGGMDPDQVEVRLYLSLQT